jgi:hypothetical protein
MANRCNNARYLIHAGMGRSHWAPSGSLGFASAAPRDCVGCDNDRCPASSRSLAAGTNMIVQSPESVRWPTYSDRSDSGSRCTRCEEQIGSSREYPKAASHNAVKGVPRSRRTYDVGIVLVLVGLTLVLLPHGAFFQPRFAAAGAALLGLLVECTWIALTFRHRSGYI